MNVLEDAYAYAEGVKSGKIVANRYIQLAIERHYADLKASESPDYPYYFCEKAAQKVLSFFDLLCLTTAVDISTVPASQVNKHGKVRFQTLPWQAFMLASIFGWKKRENGKRRFREAYIEIPRKNGKSTIASGIANYLLIADNESSPQVFFGAYTRDQANICFNEAVSQLEASPDLRKHVTILRNSVTVPRTRGKMVSVSHDKKNTEGRNPNAAIIDEYHVHATDGVKNSLSFGQSARLQPLNFVITTAGHDRQAPCYKHREICIGMLEGNYTLDSMFVMIFGIDQSEKEGEGDDWKDEKNWIKANPSMGIATQIDQLRAEFDLALRSGTHEVEFKTKRLNIWVDAAETWIPSETWNALANPDFKPPRGWICYGGLDLATTSDICAFSLYFPKYDFFLRYFYCPKAAVDKSASSGVDYTDWVNAGALTVAGEKTTDYEVIIQDIETAAEHWDLQFIGFDRWGAVLIKDRLTDLLGSRYVKKKDAKNYEYHTVVNQFGQGYSSMSPPSKAYEKAILDGQLSHDGNPVMGWMVGNVVMTADAAGNIKPDKAKSSNKIDGVVSDIMALGTYEEFQSTHTSDQILAW